jgi:hypothetical protein
MQRKRGMRSPGRIDRRKHEVDVTERVLEGGVWTGPTPVDGAHVVGIDYGVRPWPLGTVDSTVQVVAFGDDRERDDRDKR